MQGITTTTDMTMRLASGPPAPPTMPGAAIMGQHLPHALPPVSGGCHRPTGFDRSGDLGRMPDLSRMQDVLDRLNRDRRPNGPNAGPPTAPSALVTESLAVSWALGSYGDALSPGTAKYGVEGGLPDLVFGKVEGNARTLEAARELMRDRSDPSNTYTLGIIEVVGSGAVAYQVVRLSTDVLEQHRKRDDDVAIHRHRDGQQATLRLVDTDEPRAGGGRRNG